MIGRYSTPKEYISLLEWKAPPPLLLPEEALSQPLSACTDGSDVDGQVVKYTADRACRERLVPTEDEGGGGLSVLRVIYILWSTPKNIY